MMPVPSELWMTIRGLARRPAYAGLAVLTIVLGAGATSAAYGLLHEVVLRPLPYAEPDRLVTVRSQFGSDLFGITQAEFLHLRDDPAGLESVVALREPALDRHWTRTDGEVPEILNAVAVTPGFFETLGVAPVLGAGFDPAPGEDSQVVVTERYWRARLGGDPGAVGRPFEIDGRPYTVAGVLPGSFDFPLGGEPADIWIMLRLQSTTASAGDPLAYRAIGRLPPATSVQASRQGTLRVLRQFRAGVPGSLPAEGIQVIGLKEDLVGSASRPLTLLFFGAALVLLVGTLNLSWLFLARNVDRRSELHVRASLGATPGRLLRQLLAEAGALAVVGGAFAVALAAWARNRVVETGGAGLSRLSDAGPGLGLLLVGIAAAVVPALIAAALSGLRVARSARGSGEMGFSTGRRHRRLARLLTGIQAGLVFSLLAVAALVMGSLREVTRVDPGFETRSTVAMELYLPDNRYGTLEELASFERRIRARLVGLPDVEAVGTISNLPLDPASWAGSFAIERREDLDPNSLPTVDWEIAGPGYFEAAGIPLLRGRAFTEEDGADASPVAVINATLARRWWPDGQALGARISGNGFSGPWRTVVGVVGDVKQQGLAEQTRGFMYVSALQAFPFGGRQLVVRSAGGDAAALVPSLRAVIQDVEPGLTIGAVRPLRDLVRASSGAFRLRSVLFGLFAAMGLLLGMAGIYGVAAHGVRTGRRAIGIRMAVGADGRTILRSVLGDGLAPVLIGLLSGLALVLVMGPLLEELLFGVRPAEPAVLGAVAALLLAAAAGAILPTAAQARNVDPARMLREN